MGKLVDYNYSVIEFVFILIHLFSIKPSPIDCLNIFNYEIHSKYNRIMSESKGFQQFHEDLFDKNSTMNSGLGFQMILTVIVFHITIHDKPFYIFNRL